MKRFTLSLLLSILFVGGSSGVAFADRNHHRNDGGNRSEYRYNRNNNNGRHDKRSNNGGKNDKKHDSFRGPGNNNGGNGFGRGNNQHPGNNHGGNNYRPGNNHVNPGGHNYAPGWRPTPPPPPAPGYGHGPGPGFEIERHPNFHKMVAQAAYGGSDVRVWRIDHDTYIVKYRKGRRWYTRRFYPYANRYDAPGLININWNPMSIWTLLPSITINL